MATELRPIRSQADLDAAFVEVDRLWNAEPGTSDADRLEVLTILIERYEAEVFPVRQPDPVAMVCFVMEQHGLKQVDLVPSIFPQTSGASEFFTGKRDLTVRSMRALHHAYDIPYEALMGDMAESAA